MNSASITSIFYNPHLRREIFYFGVVGVLSATLHISIVVALVQLKLLSPLLANVVAFFCAFNVSYFGHRYFTFARENSHSLLSLPRFLVVTTFSFILNETLFYVLLKFFYYPIALALVILMVSGVTYFFSKFWAFR